MWMQLMRPTGDSLKKPFSDVGEAPNCSPSSFRAVDADPRPHGAESSNKFLAKEGLAQPVVMASVS